MTTAPNKITFEDLEPERKISDIKRDSRTIKWALDREEAARTLSFSGAVTLLHNEIYEMMDYAERIKDTVQGSSHVELETIYRTIKKFDAQIKNLTPSTVNDLLLCVDKYDIWLCSSNGPSSTEYDAARKITQSLLRWCSDLSKF